jgi:hypothetical protein
MLKLGFSVETVAATMTAGASVTHVIASQVLLARLSD